MKCLLAALAVLIVAASTLESADAQYRTQRALFFGAKIGASSYRGDAGSPPPGTPAFNATYEFEAYYRLHRLLSVGIRQSTGGYPNLESPSVRRHSTALGIRSYLLDGRFSPYMHLGVGVSYGGERTGLGVSSAIGAEMAFSRRVAIFQELSFDTVSPDEALDGQVGGTAFDVFGRIGIGIRVGLGKLPAIMHFDGVIVPDIVEAGTPVELRAEVRNAGGHDLRYDWELPGGAVTGPGTIVHTFSRPGRYEFDVVVTGPVGRSSRRVRVDVLEARTAESDADVAEDPMSTAEVIDQADAPVGTPERIPEANAEQLEAREPLEIGQQERTPDGINWAVGGFTWVVETVNTRADAEARSQRYASLGFPIGIYEDSYNGRAEYHVVVGQSATKQVAERIGTRIQRHVPTRIWMLEINP